MIEKYRYALCLNLVGGLGESEPAFYSRKFQQQDSESP
jgi:hypothetical protein